MFDFIKKLFSKQEEIDPQMKYLIVGLGNMHPDYDDTRHNIGFEVVDALAHQNEGKFKNDTLGDLCLIKHKGRFIHLLKPSTYMNLSGNSVRHWMLKHKIPLENVLIVVDDLNIDFGKLRMRAKGADGGHNGLKSIAEQLNTTKYPRLRVGIGDNFSKGRQIDYVLGKWSKKEREGLQEVIDQSCKACLSFASIGLSRSMNAFNSK
jgi:peptidyl-tRNA hydrolase, PTH1 family